MLASLTRLASAAFKYYLVSEVTKRNLFDSRRWAKIAGGVALASGSAALALVGVVIFIAALFFQLSDLFNFVKPALIAGAISWLLALLAFIQGVRLIRS